MRRASTVAALIAVAALVACRRPVPAAEHLSAEDATAVRSVDAAFMTGANTSDAAKLASLYTADAVLLAPGMPPQIGPEAIGKAFGAMMVEAIPHLAIKATHVDGEGDLAYLLGEYRLTWTPKKAGAAAIPAEQGHYLEVLRRQSDGTWKMVANMYNTDASPAGPAPKK